MRFLVELMSVEGGRVAGAVSAAGGPPAPFSGWLELLRLLEDGVESTPEGDPVPGSARVQEA